MNRSPCSECRSLSFCYEHMLPFVIHHIFPFLSQTRSLPFSGLFVKGDSQGYSMTHKPPLYCAPFQTHAKKPNHPVLWLCNTSHLMSCRDSEYFGNFHSFVTSQPLLPHRHGPGCHWPTSSSQSELRRFLIAAVMLMKSSYPPHWAVHHPSLGTDVHDVTSQAERPSAHGRLLGYFCHRWERANIHKHRLLEFLLIKGKHKTFSEVTAKKCQG